MQAWLKKMNKANCPTKKALFYYFIVSMQILLSSKQASATEHSSSTKVIQLPFGRILEKRSFRLKALTDIDQSLFGTEQIVINNFQIDHKELFCQNQQLPKILIKSNSTTILPPNLNSKQNPLIVLSMQSKLNCLRYSSHNYQLIFYVQNSTNNIYPQNKRYQLRCFLPFPFNSHPQQTNHIFIGQDEDQIRSALFLNKLLKYKMGVIIHGAYIGVLIGECCFPAQRFKAITGRHCGVSDILKNTHIRVTSFPYKLHITRSAQGKPIAGHSFMFIQTVANYYNSTFDLRTEGYQNIGQNSDGTWNGFIGLLVNDSVDLVMSIGNQLTRHPYADFSPQQNNFPCVFITPLPKAQLKWFGILLVFEPDVWLAISVAMLLGIFVLYQMFTFKFNQLVENPISTAVFLPLAALLMQSLNIPQSVRYLMCLFLFFSIVTGTFFGSNLISFLTLPQLEPIPETPEDLAKMTDVEINIMKYSGDSMELFFKHVQSPVLLNIKNRMKKIHPKDMIGGIVNTSIGIKSALINYELNSRVVIAENLSLHPAFTPVKTSKAPLFNLLLRVVMRKYSKFTEAINANVGKLENTGHFQKWTMDVLKLAKKRGVSWLRDVEKNGGDEATMKLIKMTRDAMTAEVKPFTISHFGIMFCSLFIGSLISVLCFTVELVSLRLFTRTT
ncbi:unnamed protein product [Allacma fusca]|uniref:Ionotropic receptor n=1 Tax=Allacma fusca TaxID=39272 RepID=A0A8J2KBQ2_9HEXA|nr:unnamed protein product [Allacma fusca]